MFTEYPSLILSNNIPTEQLLSGCSGTKGGFTITTDDLNAPNVVVGQYLFNETISSGPGMWAKITNISNIGAVYTFTVDTPNLGDFAAIQLVARSLSGVISEVSIVNSGKGYNVLPRVDIPEPSENLDESPFNYRQKAKITVTSNDIGKIKNIKIIDQGINHEEIPLLKGCFNAIVYTPTISFKPGEYIYDKNYNYGSIPPTIEQILEGPHGKVKYYDDARNLLILDETTETYELETETGLLLTIETGKPLTNEYNIGFDYTSILVGQQTGAETKIKWYNLANLLAKNGTLLKRKNYFDDISGFLSNSNIMLHDGYKVQDYSYFIKTLPTIINGLSTDLGFSEYKEIIKKLVHPAGYLMFGDTNIYGYSQLPFNLYQKVSALGDLVEPTVVLVIVMDMISLFNSLDMETLSDSSSYYLYRQLMLKFEQYLYVFNNLDNMNDTTRRMCTVIEELYTDFGGILNHPYAATLMWSNEVATFEGFTPSDLERVKFNMVEENDLFESLTFEDMNKTAFDDKFLWKINPMQPVVII